MLDLCSKLNKEPSARCPTQLAEEQVPISVNKEFASLMISSGRASNSGARLESQRSARPAELPAIADI
jgi:hypothetical protein